MTAIRAHIALLPILHALLTECSVSRAAETLNLTQSAVSQALSRARKVWGDELLVRHGQRMFPTPLAIDLAARIGVWMTETEALLQRPDLDLRNHEARVIITASDYAEIALLPPVLRTLNECAPRVTAVLRSVEAYPLDSPEFIEGKFHFAIAGTDPPPGPFETKPLFREHFVLIARRDHPLVKPSLSMEDYLRLQHVLVTPQGQGATGPIDAYLDGVHATRRVVLSVTRFTSLPSILAATDMVATVPARFAALPDVQRICQTAPLPFSSPVFAMTLIWHRRYRNDPLHRWLRDIIATQIF